MASRLCFASSPPQCKSLDCQFPSLQLTCPFPYLYRPDDELDDGKLCFPAEDPICCVRETFDDDDGALTPGLEIAMIEGAENELELGFCMSHRPMTIDELARYLGYCLPW